MCPPAVTKLNPNSHRVVHIGPTLFEEKHKVYKNFQIKLRLTNHLVRFLLRMCLFKKHPFIYVCFMRPRPSDPKSRSYRSAPVRA